MCDPAPAAGAAVRAAPAVGVEGLVKTFAVERHHPTVFSALQYLALGRRSRFVALDDINVDVARGDRVAVIGDNGAGKTAFLKIVAGLLRPTRGRVTLHGPVTLLSGLGVGMLGDLTVTDNIALYTAIYGLDRVRTRASMQDIVEWADLREFADTKLKHLSSGMRTRLAFSALRHIDKDIYLLDEVLTAGDRNFAKKCDDVFHGYERRGKTVLAATHDRRFVETFCTRALWLHKGRQIAFGEAGPIAARYFGGSAA